MKKLSVLLLILLSVAFTGTSVAKPPPHANNNKEVSKEKSMPRHKANSRASHSAKKVGKDDLVYASITALAAREIALHGGWTGYQPLPPGITKNLSRGKPLPPGIAKKTIPSGMLKKLPAHPGYEWYSVGRDLVLVSLATLVIAGVLHGVFD